MVEESSTSGRTGAQSVDRALAALSLFAVADADELSLTQVAAGADLSPSTAHRLLRALVRAGYVAQDPVTERYRLGPAAVVLGRAADAVLHLGAGQSVVDELARSSGETASVGIRDGNDVVIVLAAESSQPLRFERSAGNRTPIHASALGKALLAFGGENPATAVGALGEPLERFTPATVCDHADLITQLRGARSTGVADNREERYLGVAAVAAPVCDDAEVARAAVGVQLPSARLDEGRRRELAQLVGDAATELSTRLRLDRI